MERLYLGCIAGASADAEAEARRRWDSIAKPLGSLGLLEDTVVKIAALTGNADVSLDRRAVVVMCADNGVVCEGVTQTGQEVTAAVAREILRSESSVCRMAEVAHADVIPVDIGMVEPVEGVADHSVARGTANIAAGPAMTREQAERAVDVGVAMVRDLAAQGYRILATGEMGIGNTTTSSAIASALLDRPVVEMTGRGAGLSDAGLRRKIAAIERAFEVNRPDRSDPFDVLSKLGGFDIAGMAGMFIGGAIYRVPVLVDGFISAVAALLAQRIRRECAISAIASHVSAEPAASLALSAAGLKPLICAGMRLGEGTGAVALLPLLDMALAVYGGMTTFGDIGIAAYEHFEPETGN